MSLERERYKEIDIEIGIERERERESKRKQRQQVLLLLLLALPAARPPHLELALGLFREAEGHHLLLGAQVAELDGLGAFVRVLDLARFFARPRVHEPHHLNRRF